MSRPDGPFHIKYRPQNFEEIRGNKETLAALKDAAGKPDCPHTFLFFGPRGCGKTTTARIFRKTLGCGDSDFKEYNAANTRGIDTTREVIESCGFAPMSGKCRVYLFDECHMLTGIAQEALLKVTEDVPKHVFFIFSTTNPEKLISTLRGRCTTYQFNSLVRGELMRLMKWVLTEEQYVQEDIDYFKDVLLQITKVCDGSPREALKLLNQAVSLDKEQALALVSQSIGGGEAQISQLCQQLLGPDDWKTVATTLKNLEGDAEQLRRAILTYMGKILLGGKLDIKAIQIMRAFKDNVFDTGKQGLIMAAATVKGLTK